MVGVDFSSSTPSAFDSVGEWATPGEAPGAEDIPRTESEVHGQKVSGKRDEDEELSEARDADAHPVKRSPAGVCDGFENSRQHTFSREEG